MRKVLIACGGTGGHLAPGIAVAEALEAQGHSCCLLISNKQVDSALILKYPQLNYVHTPGRAFSGGVLSRLASLWSLCSSYLFSRQLIRTFKPDVVLLFGGFVSVGLGLAARSARIPIALHEANCVAGKTIRLLKRLAQRIYLPDGLRLANIAPKVIRYYGYPVRADIKHQLKVDARRALGVSVHRKLLVVIGGSQGASALNAWVLASFTQLAHAGISVYCVTGLGKSNVSTIDALDSSGNKITATFVPFSAQMNQVISAADLLISRAGAGSIAEIIRCRAPAILIPYPHASDDHQNANARMHEQHGVGLQFSESDLSGLLDETKELIYNDWVLGKFKSNLSRLDRFDSCQRIADDIVELSLCSAAPMSGLMESMT